MLEQTPRHSPAAPAPLAPGAHVAGVDLGGSNIRVLLARGNGETVAELAAPTPQDDADAVVDGVVAACRDAAARGGVDWSTVAGIGLGVPGVPGARGLRLAPNLPPFTDGDLAGALSGRLGVPVAVENDVNLAALAEHRHGGAVGLDDFVFIALGTGIGMGIVSGGALSHGATGAAGEIAGLPIGADPFAPANHLRGALEEAAGGLGLASRYARRTGGDPVTAGEVFARAERGDDLARELVAEQARAVALGVLAVHSVLDPALVVMGGGIGSRSDVIERVRATLGQVTRREIRVAPSALGERAGAVGATLIALDAARGAADA